MYCEPLSTDSGTALTTYTPTPPPLMMSALETSSHRELVDALRRHVGSFIDLPQIAVVGDTSSGKSSVLSALSGIEFPSSGKLCTTCPIQLQMTRSDRPFTGTIYLQSSSTGGGANHEQGKHPFSLEDSARVIGEFMDMTAKDEQTGISDDVIVVEVSGPEMPSLTLIDLPGLVQSVSDQASTGRIEQIKSMVKGYMQQSRTMILAVLTAGTVIDNQEVIKLAREADPAGDRTMAILTKPDLIDQGDHGMYRDILLNRAVFVKLGWYSLKCRTSGELQGGRTLAESLQAEVEFFRSGSLWKGIPKDNLGCDSIRTRLAHLLQELTQQQLPGVVREIEQQLDKVQGELQHLGPVLDCHMKRRREFIGQVQKMVSLVDKSALSYGSEQFFEQESHRWRAIAYLLSTEFKDVLRKSVVFILKNDDEDYEAPKSEDDEAEGGEKKQGLNLAQLRRHIVKQLAQSHGDELPGFLNYSVFVRCFREYFLNKWREPTSNFFTKVHGIGLKIMLEVVADLKCREPLAQYLAQTCGTVMQEMYTEGMEKLTELSKRENSPTTLNHYYFDNIYNLRTSAIESQLKALGTRVVDDQEYVLKSSILAVLKKFSDQTNEEHEAEEMIVMLRSYAKVAMKRYVDNVEQVVVVDFMKGVASRLDQALQVVEDERLARMFRETSGVAQLRAMLSRRIEGLTNALAICKQSSMY